MDACPDPRDVLEAAFPMLRISRHSPWSTSPRYTAAPMLSRRPTPSNQALLPGHFQEAMMFTRRYLDQEYLTCTATLPCKQ